MVAIYCRVSTTHEAQEESLDIQIKTLKQVVADNPKWMHYHVYSDKDSGGNVFRPDFQKLIFDCYEYRIDIVLLKTISRFARNTVDLLETVSRLKGLGIEVISIKKIYAPVKQITICLSQPSAQSLRLKVSQQGKRSSGD
ncbi:MAG: site-specific recombinase DNA invertase Pin [Bacillota bacterium]|nr:MAG: site-specific recombinase DNA invertase Pin [Bacillota bacterium]